eukprot:jgi/Ulvmu1/11047/UM007_0229.1
MTGHNSGPQVYTSAAPSAPPHPAAQSLYPNIEAPSPFPGFQADSPKANGSSYFASAASGSSAYPTVHPPPQTNGRTAPTRTPVKSSTSRSSPSRSALTCESSPEFQVSVSDPHVVVEPSPIAVPGFQRKHVLYAVTARSGPHSTASLGAPSITVERRFSDFVQLADLLKQTHRGFFLPLRPSKHARHSGKFKPAFIERRRAALELYLQALCSHREVARSSELRTFLQTSGDLRRAQGWTALRAPAPTWRHGVQRLLKQMVGRETLTPAPAEAARSTGASHDVVRSCREAVYGYRHRGDSELPEHEQELRRKSDQVRARISSAATLTHTMLCAQHAAAANVHSTAELGAAFSKLAAFEADNMHVELADAEHAFGGGCQRVATAAGEDLGAAATVAQEMEDQARMLRGGLDALRAREEALRTAQTLDADLERKRSRSEQLQANHNSRAVAAIQHLALAEAAQAAAWSEYEAVAQRNDAEIAVAAAAQVRAVTTRVSDWAAGIAASSEAEAAAWLRLARNLSADPAMIAHLEQM